MSFLSPAFLAALPLLGVPLLIHLLSKRQQKKISWGAMRFLMQAATRKRRLWRLTDLLLLLLRGAAFLFFIGALARPLMPARWLGGTVPRDIVLVLDQSMSMSRKVKGVPLFDLAVRRASALLDELKPADTVRILLAAESPLWLNPEPVPASAKTIRRLEAQLAELKPTLGAASLIACVREAADLEAPKDKSARIIAVICDRQRFGWRVDEKPLWAAVQARIQHAPIETTVLLEPVDDDAPAANLCVESIEVAHPFGAVDQPLAFTASVHNYSRATSAATLLSWRINEQPAGVATVPELAPGAKTTVTLSHPFAAAGTFDVACRLESGDDLPADDEDHLLVDIYDHVPVLLAAETVSAEPLENDASFVLAALGRETTVAGAAAWHSVFEPALVDPKALGSTNLGRFRCVMLADPGPLPAATIERLERYVENGGGLWIALGARTDASWFNEQFHRGGAGLAPFESKGAVGDPSDRERFFTARAASDTHPATALLADFQKLDLDQARIYRRHQFDALSGKDVSVLLQAGGGEPLVVEKKFGRGRVLVQGVPLGVSWSTLPLCQAYVAMLHEWLWYLAEPGLPRRNVAPGETLIASASGLNARASLSLPDGRKVELSAEAGAAGPVFRHVPNLPGEYVLVDQLAAAPTKFHVRRNPAESDLAALSDQESQQLASMKAFRVGATLSSVEIAKAEGPKHPLEGWLLVLLAAILFGELMLAGWSTHRRNLRARPVTMAP